MSTLKSRPEAVAILLLAVALRTVLLGLKPPHFDEGVNGWFVDQLTTTGRFRYDPSNYHGPLHFYVLFLFQTLFGRHIEALRFPVVIVSSATVWLVLLFDRFLGRRVSALAALAMAVSPAAVFYGRYAIHESWLVFFLILTLWGAIGLWRTGTRLYLWAVTLGLTGMVLTKETYFIHVAAFLLATVTLGLYEMISPSDEATAPVAARWTWRDLTFCVTTSLGVIFFFYSGNLLDLRALEGLYQTYGAWAHKGKIGEGHEKPFYYWFTLIIRYEWLALAGMLAAFAYLWRGSSRLIRYLAIYGAGTVVAYSIVPYKTPWCIISLLWPFFFVFADAFERFKPKLTELCCGLTGLLLGAGLFWDVWLNFYHYTDEAEPYVYVQTLNDVHKLTDPLAKSVAEDPSNYHLDAHIILSSYHPLPWLLGDFTGIGYWGDENGPPDYDGDFILVDNSRIEEVQNALHQEYFTEALQLRASQDPSTLYLNVKRFGKVFPNRPPDFVPAPTE